MISTAQELRLEEAKAIPIEEVADRLGIEGLRRQGQELVGPCPVCGGRDRFAIHARRGVGQCRQCDLRFGDGPGLVMAVNTLSLPDAITWLIGDAPIEVDAAEIEKRRKWARRNEERRAAEAERYRQRARDRGRFIWETAHPMQEGDAAWQYLEGRGIPPAVLAGLAPALRLSQGLTYRRRIDGETHDLHQGPAMVARIDTPREARSAVHCTWVDPARPGRKAVIPGLGEDAEKMPAKLVFGSAKGGVIALTRRKSDTLVMGEGIETTLSALAADPYPGADYWAGISLGNMAGRMRRIEGQRYSGLPDLEDDRAFLPPARTRRLVFLQDGDSDPKATRAKLEAGLRRAAARIDGLAIEIVAAPRGKDFNDVLQEEGAP